MARNYKLTQTGQEVQNDLYKIEGIGPASSSQDGLMAASDKAKLDGIQAGAQVNPPVDATPTAGSGNPVSSGGVASAIADFITRTVNDLVNYYTKSQTYTKSEVDSLMAGIRQFAIRTVSILPDASAATMWAIYLVPSQELQTGNAKDEYITIDNGAGATDRYTWELIGSTAINLEGYVTDSYLQEVLTGYVSTSAFEQALGGKADKVSGATSGNFAGLDANGNLTDSGKKASDFATAAQGAKADTAYQKPSGGIPETDLLQEFVPA